MMDWDDTPTTLALKHRIRELEAENSFLRNEKAISHSGSVFTSISDLSPLDLSFETRQLTVAAEWGVTWDKSTERAHAIGRSVGGPRGEISYKYFMEDSRMLHPGMAHDVLAHLHKRLVMELAKDWETSDGWLGLR